AEDGGGGGGDFTAQGKDGLERGALLGMDGVGEDDDVGAGGGIDPERSAGEAGMSVGADGKEVAAVAGEGGVEIPAEAADLGKIEGRLRGGHLGDAEGGEDAGAVFAAAAVEHHLGVFGKV